MTTLPTGTVTFLFTDIEGSTRLLEARPEAYRAALARHDALVRRAVADHGGVIFQRGGDGFCAAFASPADARSGRAQIAACAAPTSPGRPGSRCAVRMASAHRRGRAARRGVFRACRSIAAPA